MGGFYSFEASKEFNMIIARIPRPVVAAFLGGSILAVGFWVTWLELNAEATLHELPAPAAAQAPVTQNALVLNAIDESLWRGYSDGRIIGPDYKVHY